mgnify:CR=1 FL=1
MKETIDSIWIDESGDSGFRFERGSSRFLVLAAVYITEEVASEALFEQEIRNLKLALRVTEDYEFKFSRCKNSFKKEFFRALARLPVQYKAIVIDKRNVSAPALQSQPKQLYCELVRRLLYDNSPPLQKATLILDEATAKVHHQQFHRTLKNSLSRNLVQKLRQHRSHRNAMIQVADMIAGSIFRKFEKGDDTYYEMVKKKEKILIEF